jgi:lysophospholipase L1-like esterase
MIAMTGLKNIPFKNLCLLFVSVLSTLALCEVILRVSVRVRYIGPTVSVYDPIYGKSHKKSFTTRRITPEYAMQFTTNSFGFRGPEPEAFPYRPILFLGDSFTVGYGVNDGEEFPALVQKALEKRYGKNRVPVVNAGMAGNGNGRWVKFLRREGKKYNPRLVILQFFDNDFNDNIGEHLFSLTLSGELEELPIPPPSKARIIQNVVEQIPALSDSYFIGLIKQVLTSNTIIHKLMSTKETQNSGNPSKDQLTFRLLEEILTLCNNKDWPVRALIVDINGQRLTELERILQLHAVPIIKVPGQSERPDLYHQIDRHWKSSGHDFVAKLIIEQLLALDLINLSSP